MCDIPHRRGRRARQLVHSGSEENGRNSKAPIFIGRHDMVFSAANRMTSIDRLCEYTDTIEVLSRPGAPSVR
jgi:hypothetical protein